VDNLKANIAELMNGSLVNVVVKQSYIGFIGDNTVFRQSSFRDELMEKNLQESIE